MAGVPAQPGSREQVDTSKPFFTHFGEVTIDITPEERMIVTFKSTLGGLPLTTGEFFKDGVISVSYKDLVKDAGTVMTLIRDLCAEAEKRKEAEETKMPATEFQSRIINKLRQDEFDFDASELEKALARVES